jgi:hypothetical protein
VRRLAEVGTARLNAVVGPNRDVDRFLVAVEVANQQRRRAVLERSKTFEGGIDRFAGGAQRFEEDARRNVGALLC